MKKFYTFILLFCASFIFSQNCKYLKNEVDEFTGKKVIELKGKFLTKGKGIAGLSNGSFVSLKQIDNKKYMLINVFTNEIATIEKGSYIMLLTSSKEVIKLPVLKTVISKPVQNYWVNEQSIILDENLIEKLINTEIAKVRFQTTDGYIDRNVKKKHFLNISKLIECINQTN